MKYVTMGTSSNFGNMFSMADAVLILSFLPMLPVQILLNNLLYDVSEIAVPFDRVDEEVINRPRHWDMDLVRNFMLVFGLISSLFDFTAFGLHLWVFHAGQSLFQTGWFVMLLASQVLVIFVIRTSLRPWQRAIRILSPAPGSCARLISRLISADRANHGLKGDIVAYEIIANALLESTACRDRTRTLRQAMTDACAGAETTYFAIQAPAQGRLPRAEFSP